MFKIVQLHTTDPVQEPRQEFGLLRRFSLALMIVPLAILALGLLVLGFFAAVIIVLAAIIVLPVWAWFRRRKWSRGNDGRWNVRVISRTPGGPWQNGL